MYKNYRSTKDMPDFTEEQWAHICETQDALLALPVDPWVPPPPRAPKYAMRKCQRCDLVQSAELYGFTEPGICGRVCADCLAKPDAVDGDASFSFVSRGTNEFTEAAPRLLPAPPQHLLLAAWSKSSERQQKAMRRPIGRYEVSQMAIAGALLAGIPCEQIASPFRPSIELIVSKLGTEKGSKYVMS